MAAGAIGASALLLASCGGGGATPVGSAFLDPPGSAWIDLHHRQPVGEELALKGTDMHSTTAHTVTLERVVFNQRGLDSTASVLAVRIAPFPGTYADVPATPDGTYVTYPPVSDYAGRCEAQKLVPVAGYTVSPHAQFSLVVLLRFDHPGTIRWRSTTFYYREGGRTYAQTEAYGYDFSVTAGRGVPVPLAPYERACLRLARRLPR